MTSSHGLLSWSYSRVDVFTRCKREYYFAYYASHGGWDKKAPKEKRELFIRKHTKNRYAWMGDLVHAVIEDFLEEFRKGKLASSEELLKAADARMRKEYRDSLEQRYRQDPGRYTGLVEHENSLQIREKQWKNIHENVMTCAANFYYTDFYKKYIVPDCKDILRIEKLDSFEVDGIKVYARPDVAVKSEDALKIIDWKTGAQNDEHEFQLCYYTLYGVHKLNTPMDKITTSLVYLKDNTKTETVMNAQKLENARQYLKSTFSEMKAFEESALREPDPGSLPAAKALSTCALCRFQKICRTRLS
jgi:CRISPR/Cas system-associated exonuclease Cas4 (RecB family)